MLAGPLGLGPPVTLEGLQGSKLRKSIDYYRSIPGSDTDLGNMVVDAAVRQGIVPTQVRYDVQNGDITGIMKSSNDSAYHFTFSTETRLLETTSVDRFTTFQKGTYGFDLKKAEELEDEETEDTEKAAGAAGGQEGSAQPSSITEEQAIAQQNRLMTEQHPGAAGGVTPDRPDRGRQWHQETVKSLQFLGEDLIKSVDAYFPKVSDSEKQFMVEILGRAPDEVDAGDTRMTPVQKVTYQKWLTKSIHKEYRQLTGWLASRS